MSSDYDIEMSTDDTLELDAIISDWSNPDTVVDLNGSDFNMSGFQTSTAVLDPQSSGEYTIKVNGQELTVNVTDASTIPDDVVDNFEQSLYEDQGNTLSDYYNGDVADFTRTKGTSFYGDYSVRADVSDKDPRKITALSTPTGVKPEKGDKFRFTYKVDNNSRRPSMWWGVSGSSQGFHVLSQIEDGQFFLFRPDGTRTQDNDVSFSLNKFYHIDVSWGYDDFIEVEHIDPQDSSVMSTLSFTDSSNSNEYGYSFGEHPNAFADANTYFDDVRILSKGTE